MSGAALRGDRPILIVDDDPLIVDLATMILGAVGYPVVAADHGDDAIEQVFAQLPALVILDCGLPGRPGLSILEEVRASTTLGDLPVLMLTGRRSAWSETIAREKGASAYLRKPFTPEQLVTTVARLVRTDPDPKG